MFRINTKHLRANESSTIRATFLVLFVMYFYLTDPTDYKVGQRQFEAHNRVTYQNKSYNNFGSVSQL